MERSSTKSQKARLEWEKKIGFILHLLLDPMISVGALPKAPIVLQKQDLK